MTTLGTLGSGLMAREVARLAIATGIEVLLSNSRNPETLLELTAELGPLAKATFPDQATTADVILLALPLGQLAKLDPALLANKVVIDLTNYYPHRDGRISELDSNALTAGQFVQARLPGARTVRVFSNISYMHIPSLARPSGAADRSALPLAGDHPDANAEVAALVNRLGFDTVEVGPLSESWRFEPDTVAYLWPYASPELQSLEYLRSTPAMPAGGEAIRQLVDRAERTDQGSRAF